MSAAAVTYESRIDAYRCFDQLYLQGYNATITIVSALSVKWLQGLNEMQLPVSVGAERLCKMTQPMEEVKSG